MLLPLATPASAPCNSSHFCNLLFSSTNLHQISLRPTPSLPLKPPLISYAYPSSCHTLRHVNDAVASNDPDPEASMLSSASAVASAIRKASKSPVEFMQRIEKDRKGGGLVLPSPDFQRLCIEQLDLFRRIVDQDAMLSVYVRPAGSYVMDRLELRRVTLSPAQNVTDIVILIGTFNIPTGLRAAEAALSNQLVQVIPEHSAVVFPMVKHPFVVGFLVAEFPMMELGACEVAESEGKIIDCPSPEEAYALPPKLDSDSWEVQPLEDEPLRIYRVASEQRTNAINISRSLAVAHVMDQKALLLQQSSWQNNIRMSNLVEQIRGPLSSIRTLSKMLSAHTKRSEIAYDMIEDILVQGDLMRDTLQQLQDAVYLTKANIVRYNEETLKKRHESTYTGPDSGRPQLPLDLSQENASNELRVEQASLSNTAKDLEMPMPPLALSPLREHEMRPCNVCDVVEDLVDAVRPLAHKQERVLQFNVLSQALQVAVEEPALRQALSNLIEGALLRTNVGGEVQIACTIAPAGGALIVIDDDGPDMHYMTQMHSLTPFGADLLSDHMVEDNMTWNFVAGLTVAREILESYGCVVRVISPRLADAALGAGGTRVELWLPFAAVTDPSGSTQEI